MPINPKCTGCGATERVNFVAGVALCVCCKPATPNTDIRELKSYGPNRTAAQTDAA